MADIVRWRCLAEGQVQGVGYRARVAAAAHRHSVVGWVTNLPDGTVALEAQGSAGAVDRFLLDIQGRRGLSDARGVRRLQQLPPSPELSRFDVR